MKLEIEKNEPLRVDYEKNEIMSLVNRYYIKPSFDGESVSGIYGSTIVLTDNNNVLSESAIKRKISKIKIEINDNNRIKKIKKGKNYINNINYKDIYKKIKNYFSKKNRKITDKKVNQTFCCLLINNQDEFNLN